MATQAAQIWEPALPRQPFLNDRPNSRADSVLDYYSQLPGSRDHSPVRLIDLSGTDTKTMSAMNSRFNSVSEIPRRDEVDEFGRMCRNNQGFGSQRISHTAQPEQLEQRSLHGGRYLSPGQGQMKKSASVSRIPIFKDRCSPVSSTSSSFRYNQSPSALSSYSAYESDDERIQQSGRSSGMPHSQSMPLDQLPPEHNQNLTDKARQEKFGSMPSRKPRAQNAQPVRRAASVSSALREEHKEAREWREDQARRVQAINQAPSGTPPWLGNFQPDPRLPADQQMLPTVAKKLAMEKWTSDGGKGESRGTAIKEALHSPQETARSVQLRISAVTAPSLPDDLGREVDDESSTAILENNESPLVCGQSPQQMSAKPLYTPNFSHRTSRETSISGSPKKPAPGAPFSSIAPQAADLEAQPQDVAREQSRSGAVRVTSSGPPVSASTRRTVSKKTAPPKQTREKKQSRSEKSVESIEAKKSIGCCSLM